MKKLFNLLSMLFCSHRHIEFVRNIHGDEINERGGKRSLWNCLNCKTSVAKGYLYDNAIEENRHAQTLQKTLDSISALKADEHFECMVSIANRVYAQFCLKEMHLDRLRGTLRGQRGPILFRDLDHVESFMHEMEGKINHLEHQIREHEGSSKRIQEVAERLGVERSHT